MSDHLENAYSIWFVWLLRVLVAGIFLFSAFAKWIGPAGFELYLVDQGPFGDRWTAGLFTRVLIGFEFALGVAYLQPFYVKHVVSPVIVGVLSVFTVYLGYAWMEMGLTGNCGCFGEVVAMGPLESMGKNVVALAMVLGIWKWIPSRSSRWYVPGGILVASVALAFLTLPPTTPGGNASGNNQFAQFIRFEGAGRVDLLRGEKMIVVANVECPHCRKATRKIGEMQAEVQLPDTYYLVYGTKKTEEVEQFWTDTNTRFPYHILEREVFLELLKDQLPTVYLLKEGQVQEVWDENVVEHIRRTFSG